MTDKKTELGVEDSVIEARIISEEELFEVVGYIANREHNNGDNAFVAATIMFLSLLPERPQIETIEMLYKFARKDIADAIASERTVKYELERSKH